MDYKSLPKLRSPLARIAPLIIMGVTALSDVAFGQLQTFNTEHYRVHSDLDPAAARDYGRRLDAMYAEYSHRLADFEMPAGKKFNVYLFKKRADYVKFTGNRLPNSAGIFIPAQRVLAGFEEGQGRAGLRQTLQHEAFHQFAWEAISEKLPIWLDEGLAQVFEEGVWTGDQFILGQVPPRRIAALQADIREGKFIPFKTFLTMSRESFQSNMRDPRTGQAQYNQAWAMTQFLIFSTDPQGKPRYRQRMLAWLRDLHDGKDAEQSFTANFSGNIDGFEARFKEWAAGVQPTPMAVYADRMSKMADLVRLFKESGTEFDSVDNLRRHLKKGQFHLTEQRQGRTYTLEENALTYLSDLSDRPWATDQLRFEKRKGRPLPDIVLDATKVSAIRVRFYRIGRDIDHEVSFETRKDARAKSD